MLVRQIFATLVFDFCIIYFNVPATLWYFYTGVINDWGLCEQSSKVKPDVVDAGYNLQLLVGVLGLITYKVAENIFYTPWQMYDVFWIDKHSGLSNATPLSFIFSRIAMLLEFVLMPVPVFCLVVKVMQWTGDYIVLAFFCLTALV